MEQNYKQMPQLAIKDRARICELSNKFWDQKKGMLERIRKPVRTLDPSTQQEINFLAGMINKFYSKWAGFSELRSFAAQELGKLEAVGMEKHSDLFFDAIARSGLDANGINEIIRYIGSVRTISGIFDSMDLDDRIHNLIEETIFLRTYEITKDWDANEINKDETIFLIFLFFSAMERLHLIPNLLEKYNDFEGHTKRLAKSKTAEEAIRRFINGVYIENLSSCGRLKNSNEQKTVPEVFSLLEIILEITIENRYQGYLKELNHFSSILYRLNALEASKKIDSALFMLGYSVDRIYGSDGMPQKMEKYN
ncbi:MAG: hypothetical protein WC501_02240 [Candidatus Micrarchaeia archaeon]